MRHFKEKYSFPVFIVVVVFSYYCLFYQLKKNPDSYEKRMDKITEAMSGENGHPILIFSPRFVGFAKAYSIIQSQPEERFWIISDYLDPAILLNYYIYPKEARMPAQTQDFINMKYLTRSEEPIEHPPLLPRGDEPVLYIDLDEVQLLTQWDGHR